MSKTQTKATAGSTHDTAKVEEKRRHPEPAQGGFSVLAADSLLLDTLLGSSAVDPRLNSHAAMLSDPRFSHSANAGLKQQMVSGLQNCYGNACVQRLLDSRAVQAKLTVNPPDDQYEREADAVADAFAQRPNLQIQRQAKDEEEEEVQMKPADGRLALGVHRQAAEEEEKFQAKSTPERQSRKTLAALEDRIQFAKGEGRLCEGRGTPTQTATGLVTAGHVTTEHIQAKAKPSATKKSESKSGVGKRVSSPQKPGESAEQRKKELREKLVLQCKEGGVTVALYVADPKVKEQKEFKREADAFAVAHNAVGLTKDAQVALPMAMPLSMEAGEILLQITERVRLLLDQEEKCKVRTLAIFTHGKLPRGEVKDPTGKTKEKAVPAGLQAKVVPAQDRGPTKADWYYPDELKKWVSSIVGCLAPDVKVVLYACHTAGTSIAETLHEKLAEQLVAQQLAIEGDRRLAGLPAPEEQQTRMPSPEVWGHTVAGHTTRIPQLKVYRGLAGKSEAWIDTCTKRMWADAIETMAWTPQKVPRELYARLGQRITGIFAYPVIDKDYTMYVKKKAEKELPTLKAALKRLNGAQQNKEQEKKRAETDLQNKIKEKSQKAAGRENDIRALDKQIEALKDKINGNKAKKIKGLTGEIKGLTGEIKRLTGQIRGLEKQIETWKGLIEGYDTQIASLGKSTQLEVKRGSYVRDIPLRGFEATYAQMIEPSSDVAKRGGFKASDDVMKWYQGQFQTLMAQLVSELERYRTEGPMQECRPLL
jgi:hypothetical protein